MFLLNIQQKPLSLPLLELVSNHVGGLTSIVFKHSICTSLYQNLNEPSGTMFCCMMKGSVSSIILWVYSIWVLVSACKQMDRSWLMLYEVYHKQNSTLQCDSLWKKHWWKTWACLTLVENLSLPYTSEVIIQWVFSDICIIHHTPFQTLPLCDSTFSVREQLLINVANSMHFTAKHIEVSYHTILSIYALSICHYSSMVLKHKRIS